MALCFFFIATSTTSPDTFSNNTKPLETLAQTAVPITVQSITNIIDTSTITNTPAVLVIKDIDLVAPIESVGIFGNTMATPLHANNAGWYNQGTRPGDIGSAVLAGHVNWFNSNNAAFTALHLVRVGMIISIINNDNTTTSFIVRKIVSFSNTANALQVFSSHDGIAHLNLITCGGAWSDTLNTHLLRLVVFTDKL